MFEITTKEDVALLKEMIKEFTTETENSIEVASLEKAISNMNKEIAKQTEANLKIQKTMLEALSNMRKQTDEQHKMILSIQKSLEGQKPIKVVKKTSVKKPEKKFTEEKSTRYLQHEDLFVPYKVSQKPYGDIELDGIRLIHNTTKGQQYALPVNILELICILEEHKKENGIIVERVNSLCQEFGINKSQFSKIYYNLLNEKFDGVLHEIDKEIVTSLFTVEKGFIYRNDKNTNISIKEFKQMYEDSIDTERPFFKIYQIIKESTDYNALDIFILLRKKDVLLRIIKD